MTHFVTFLSYRAAVGKTTSLLSVAWALASRGKRVFVWDLDLEAPALLDLPLLSGLRKKAKGGSLDLLERPELTDAQGQLSAYVLPFQDPKYPKVSFQVLPAGVHGPAYFDRFAQFDMAGLFGGSSTAGADRAERIRQAIYELYRPDFVLIDTHGGLGDLSLVSTVQLADTVVLVYNLTAGSVQGTQDIQARLTQLGQDKAIRRADLRIRRVATLVPTEPADLIDQAKKSAIKIGLQPDYEIGLQGSLFLEQQLFVREFPDHDAVSAPYYRLAEELAAFAQPQVVNVETVALGRSSGIAIPEVIYRPPTFEDRVERTLQLMGFEVRRSDHPGIDFWATEITKRKQRIPHAVEAAVRFTPAKLASFEQARAAAPESPHGILVIENPADLPPSRPELEITSYRDFLDGLCDFGNYNELLVSDVAGTPLEHLYVEPDVLPEDGQAGPREKLALRDYIDNFLSDPNSTFLALLGDYGSGKTWFTQHLAWTLARRYAANPALRRPIRISLRDVNRAFNLENILENHFRERARLDLNPEAVLHLNAEGRLVLILDAFDEMATAADWSVTLENFRQLVRAAVPGAKVILTCRAHYFRDRDEAGKVLKETQLYAEARALQGARIAGLSLFSTEQIQDYFRRAAGDRAGELARLLEREETLGQLATRPILLDLIVKAAPELVRAGVEVNTANLYQKYVDFWLDRDDWRTHLTRERKQRLMEQLAAHLWNTDDARIHYVALAEMLQQLLPDLDLRALGKVEEEIRTASFFVRDAAGRYAFAHRSFLEYFIARHLVAASQEGVAQFALALDMRPPSSAVERFLSELAGLRIGRAAAGVLESADRPRPAENALRLWIATGQPVRPAGFRLSNVHLAAWNLDHLDLSGADLRASDLTQASCRGAKFRSADLTGANLAGSDCQNADFTGARQDATNFDFANLWSSVGIRRPAFGAALHAPTPAAWQDAPRLVADSWFGGERRSAIDPNGRWAAFPRGSSIAIFDLATFQLRRTLEGHGDAVWSVAVTPDGRHLVSGSMDKTLRLWNLETGRAVRTLEGHGAAVWSVAVTPDGRHLVSGSMDKTLRLWNLETGRAVRTLEGHGDAVWSVAVTPDGRHLVSGSMDNTLRLWNLETGRAVRTLEGHGDAVLSVAVTPDGRHLVSGSMDKTLRLWNLETGRAVRTLEGHGADVLSVAVTPDGRHLVSGSSDKTLRLWNLETGRAVRTLEGHGADVLSVAVTPDGRHLVSGSMDNTLRLWNLETGRAVRTLEGHGADVLSVAVTPDGRHLVSGSSDKTLRLWNLETGRAVRTLEGHGAAVLSVAVTPDGRHLVSGSMDKTLRLWNLETGRAVRTLEGHGAAVLSVAVTPDGRHLVSGSMDKTLRLWNLETGRAVRTLEGHGDAVWSVAVTPDGRHLVSGSMDNTLRLWNLETGRAVRTLEGHGDAVLSVAVTPDGRHLVSGSMDKTLRLWNLETGRAVRTLEGHGADVLSVAVTPDGRHLVSGSSDNTLRLWNLETGRAVRTLEGHGAAVWSVAVTPDGRHLVSGSSDNTLRLWNLETGEELCSFRVSRLGDPYGVMEEPRPPEGGARHLRAISTPPEARHRLRFLSGWALYPWEAAKDLEKPEAFAQALGFTPPPVIAGPSPISRRKTRSR